MLGVLWLQLFAADARFYLIVFVHVVIDLECVVCCFGVVSRDLLRRHLITNVRRPFAQIILIKIGRSLRFCSAKRFSVSTAPAIANWVLPEESQIQNSIIMKTESGLVATHTMLRRRTSGSSLAKEPSIPTCNRRCTHTWPFWSGWGVRCTIGVRKLRWAIVTNGPISGGLTWSSCEKKNQDYRQCHVF